MITPLTWKRLCYSVIVLLLPYLLLSVINGRWWVTLFIWAVGLVLVWFRPAERSRG